MRYTMQTEELIERIKQEKSFVEFYALKGEILKHLQNDVTYSEPEIDNEGE